MGLSKTPAELSAKLMGSASSLASVPASATRAAALFQKEVILGTSPSRLRNVGRKGARLGVGVRVVESAAGATGVVRARGPWQIIEFDTKPHVIPRQNRRNAKPLVLPGGQVRASVNHPGTTGKHLFAKAAGVARPLIPRVYQRALTLALARSFR